MDGATRTRHRYTATSVAEAQTWRRDALQAIRRGRELPGRSRATLREACDDALVLMRQGVVRNRGGQLYKPQTIRMYEHNLARRIYEPLGLVPVSEVDHHDLQELVDGWLAEGLSPHTIRSTVIPLARILRRELERGRITTSPTVGLSSQRPGDGGTGSRTRPRRCRCSPPCPSVTGRCGRPRCTPAFVAVSFRRSGGAASSSTWV